MDGGQDEAFDTIRVAVLCGSDNERTIGWDRSAIIDSKGNNDSWRLLSQLDRQHFSWRRMHITPGYFRQQRRWSLGYYHLAWNMITDPDQNPQTLEVATKVLASLKLPVVNRPSLIESTRRDRVAQLLQGTPDVVVPKVLLLRNPTKDRVERAVQAAGFRFPAIVRLIGTQSGKVLGICANVDDMRPIFGDRRHAFFMTEFHDLRFGDGFFRKTRFMFIGDAIVARQHIISDNWNVHGADNRRVTATREAFQQESDAMLLGGAEALRPRDRDRLAAIRQRVPLDYFGLDCCLAEDGRLVVFEVNATMNIWPMEGRMDDDNRRIPTERAIAAVRWLILAKTRLLDPALSEAAPHAAGA